MARSDAYKPTLESPVEKYLTWSSNDKCFAYYSKAANKMVQVPLPVKLIHFDEFATIKGFHDRSGSSIYSNEVKSVNFEELNVRSFKGGELAKGMYKDIKAKVNELGGSYHTSLYALLDGEIVNIQMKGSAVQAWSDFAKESRKSFLSSYIEVKSAIEAKKGSVKYTTPEFKIGDLIDAKESKAADAKYDELMEYFNARKANANQSSSSNAVASYPEAEEVVSVAPSQDEFDALPF